MKYDLVKPCASCPFRSDITPFIRGARVEEIQSALVRSTFACHKTVEWDDEGENTINDEDQHHCAGALILLEKSQQSSQMMRIMERLGGYDRIKLAMDAPVYDSFEEMIEACKEVVG